MEQRLKNIFDFLVSNRQYNKRVQGNYYKAVLLPYSSTEGRATSLLYNVVNTQSRPKIDKLAAFFKSINHNGSLTSFKNFSRHLHADRKVYNYHSLFEDLKNQPGWGEKTSALLIKSIFHLHSGVYDKRLSFWPDAPKLIDEDDQLFVPVDAVIISIFNKLDPENRWHFNSINRLIKKYYTGKDIEVWDDLWFWGFINQRSGGSQRTFEWNDNKYWILPESVKDQSEIKVIKQKSKEFLNLL